MRQLAASPGNDWTDDERPHIDRLQRLCKSTSHWELECSHTDAGDPWCIIYDRNKHKIVLHIARIERRYVIVWPEMGQSTTRATIEAAVDAALAEKVLAGVFR